MWAHCTRHLISTPWIQPNLTIPAFKPPVSWSYVRDSVRCPFFLSKFEKLKNRYLLL